MNIEKKTEIFEIKESLRFDVEDLVFTISYSTSKASVNWSLNLNPSQLVFADPIKISNGARILSIDIFQKDLADFSAFESLPKTHVKLVEKYDSATVFGFDLFGIDKQGNRKTYFNGMVCGYFSFEFYTVSARQSCIVLFGFQDGYLSKFPFCLGDTKETYAKKYKKPKPESSFIQKKESFLVVKEKIKKEKIKEEKILGFLPNNRFVTLLVLTPLAYFFSPFSLNPLKSNNIALAGNCGSSMSLEKQSSTEFENHPGPARSQNSSNFLNNSQNLNTVKLPTAIEARKMVFEVSKQVAAQDPTNMDHFSAVMSAFFDRREPIFNAFFGSSFTQTLRTDYLLDNSNIDPSRASSDKSDKYPQDVRTTILSQSSSKSIRELEPFAVAHENSEKVQTSGEVQKVNPPGNLGEAAGISGASTLSMGMGGSQSITRSTSRRQVPSLSVTRVPLQTVRPPYIAPKPLRGTMLRTSVTPWEAINHAKTVMDIGGAVMDIGGAVKETLYGPLTDVRFTFEKGGCLRGDQPETALNEQAVFVNLGECSGWYHHLDDDTILCELTSCSTIEELRKQYPSHKVVNIFKGAKVTLFSQSDGGIENYRSRRLSFGETWTFNFNEQDQAFPNVCTILCKVTEEGKQTRELDKKFNEVVIEPTLESKTALIQALTWSADIVQSGVISGRELAADSFAAAAESLNAVPANSDTLDNVGPGLRPILTRRPNSTSL